MNFEYNTKQRSYLLLTEANYGHCDKGSIKMCLAKTAVYNKQSLKRGASLKFSEPKTLTVCADGNGSFTTGHHVYNGIVNCGSNLQQVTLWCSENNKSSDCYLVTYQIGRNPTYRLGKLKLSDKHDRITASLCMMLNHSCIYTQICYFRKSERKILLLQLSFALFRLLIPFVLSSIHTHGTEDTAAMKSVQEETQKTVSDFASGTLTHQETS